MEEYTDVSAWCTQVKLNKQHKGSEPLPVGVIMGSPEERQHIRYNPQRLESAVVVYKNTIYNHSRQVSYFYCFAPSLFSRNEIRVRVYWNHLSRLCVSDSFFFLTVPFEIS